MQICELCTKKGARIHEHLHQLPDYLAAIGKEVSEGHKMAVML